MEATEAADSSRSIAYQGIAGSYSHLACQDVHPKMEPLACETFEDAFRAVEAGDAALAMIPIENSLGGRVADIHHLLPGSKLYFIGEHFQAVHHHLLAPPGATLESLRSVASHVQGLAQCRSVIRELGLTPIARGDTAGAAREVAESGDSTRAAIASRLAGEIYGLESLRGRIEDRLGNTTRFVLMSRRRADPDPRDGACMTAFIFQVRSIPGALYKSLGGFATGGINITKLESYITDSSFQVAQFYAEIEGHPSDTAVTNAFEELQFFSTTVKVIGSFPKHPFRTRD